MLSLPCTCAMCRQFPDLLLPGAELAKFSLRLKRFCIQCQDLIEIKAPPGFSMSYLQPGFEFLAQLSYQHPMHRQTSNTARAEDVSVLFLDAREVSTIHLDFETWRQNLSSVAVNQRISPCCQAGCLVPWIPVASYHLARSTASRCSFLRFDSNAVNMKIANRTPRPQNGWVCFCGWPFNQPGEGYRASKNTPTCVDSAQVDPNTIPSHLIPIRPPLRPPLPEVSNKCHKLGGWLSKVPSPFPLASKGHLPKKLFHF